MSKALPKYLTRGFTITMWVKFRDRVNGGTLFNFGNPVRELEPFGYRLETFIAKKDDFPGDFTFDDGTNLEDNGFFLENSYERFVRLAVFETDGQGGGNLRTSSVGSPYLIRHPENDIPNDVYSEENKINRYFFSYTKVPID